MQSLGWIAFSPLSFCLLYKSYKISPEFTYLVFRNFLQAKIDIIPPSNTSHSVLSFPRDQYCPCNTCIRLDCNAQMFCNT